MYIDFANFMLSLAAFVADKAKLTLGKELWSMQADEATVKNANASAYAVMLNYSGGSPNELLVVHEPSIQVMATSKVVRDAMTIASRICAALYQKDADGSEYGSRPIHDFVLPAKAMIDGNVSDDPNVPDGYWIHQAILHDSTGLVGVDEFSRNKVSFNFTIRFQLN